MNKITSGTKKVVTTILVKVKGCLKRLFFCLPVTLGAAALMPMSVAAAGALQESDVYKGLMDLLKDVSLVIMIAAPILGAILIGYCSIMLGANSEPHDKEKWSKNRKTVIIAMAWVFGAGSIVGIISSYFGSASI